MVAPGGARFGMDAVWRLVTVNHAGADKTSEEFKASGRRALVPAVPHQMPRNGPEMAHDAPNGLSVSFFSPINLPSRGLTRWTRWQAVHSTAS
jgi:hypothetical protein